MKAVFFFLKQAAIYYFFCLIMAYSTKCAAQEKYQEFVSGEVIVQLDEGSTPLDLVDRFKSIELKFKSKISKSLNLYCFNFSSEKIDNKGALNLIQECNFVELVQNNHYVVFNSIPNDEFALQQWAMQKIEAPNAWNISTGGNTAQNDEIVIAVLDGGFDLQHDDINYWKNSSEIPDNGIDDDGNYIVDDYHGYNAFDNNGIIPLNSNHGTIVAGIAGAKGNNTIGITGVNWNVKIMPIVGSTQTEEVVLRGYDYVLEMRKRYNESSGSEGAFVVVTNASFSTIPSSQNKPENFPFWCQMYDSLGAEGVLSVNAPWNKSHEIGANNNNYEIPATCESEYLIVVTATDENDELYNKPNSSDGSPWSNEYVDMAAPGVDIISTLPGGGYGIGLENTGTSVSAPFVSSAISLLYANACNEFIQNYKTEPSVYALEIRDLIFDWTDFVPALVGKTKYGRLNIYKSLSKMQQQFDADLTVSGIESESRNYEAINVIDVNNYNSTPHFDVKFKAGKEINFQVGTDLVPAIDKCIIASIELSEFDCAIPFEPLTVDLFCPKTSSCNFLGTTCNAFPFGGKPPYSFVWRARKQSESDFTIFTPNTPNMLFVFDQDFFVQVEVIDDRGFSISSDIQFVNCLLQRIGNNVDAIADSTSQNNLEESDLISKPKGNSNFKVYPNPTNTMINVSAILDQRNELTIFLYDITGKLISELIKNKHYESGAYEHKFDISECENGIYFISIFSNSGTSTYKIVKVK